MRSIADFGTECCIHCLCKYLYTSPFDAVDAIMEAEEKRALRCTHIGERMVSTHHKPSIQRTHRQSNIKASTILLASAHRNAAWHNRTGVRRNRSNKVFSGMVNVSAYIIYLGILNYILRIICAQVMRGIRRTGSTSPLKPMLVLQQQPPPSPPSPPTCSEREKNIEINRSIHRMFPVRIILNEQNIRCHAHIAFFWFGTALIRSDLSNLFAWSPEPLFVSTNKNLFASVQLAPGPDSISFTNEFLLSIQSITFASAMLRGFFGFFVPKECNKWDGLISSFGTQLNAYFRMWRWSQEEFRWHVTASTSSKKQRPK